MDDSTNERRRFLTRAAGLAATTLAATAAASGARAAEHEHGTHGATGKGGADGYVMSSKVEKLCATCEFWGGQRRLSTDGAEITVGGLGWCNNPDSPNHHKLTSPEHGPMGVWKRWSVLG